ncbi:MAG: arginase family protein [Enterocloster clostridioformis]
MRGSLHDPDEHGRWRQSWEMKLIPPSKVREMGLKTLVTTILERVGDKPCFLTFDIDFVDPGIVAPGTGTC